MELYFSPMACSLASRIALYEAGAKGTQFIEVDPRPSARLVTRIIWKFIHSGSSR
jgi:hypothetical protein